MQLIFDSIAEVKEFLSQLKGTRGGKNASANDDGSDTGGAPAPGNVQAPAPMMPPQGGAAPVFAPGGQPPAFNPAPGFPGAPGVDPAVAALVARIVTRIDGAIAGGQPADAALTWFRAQCGPEAANATLDQIKTVFLPRLSMPSLDQIAKLMGA